MKLALKQVCRILQSWIQSRIPGHQLWCQRLLRRIQEAHPCSVDSMPVYRCMYVASLQGMGVLNHKNFHVSGEAYWVEHVLPFLFKDDASLVLCDVGGHVGNFSQSLRNSFPLAQIHGFEPHPKNAHRFREVLGTQVNLYNIALGEAGGQLTLHARKDRDESSHSSLYESVITDLHGVESVAFHVPVETLDNWAGQHQVKKIDFIKIDTEGHEMAVLKGARELLTQRKIGIIQFEFNEMNAVSRVFLRDFKNLLTTYSFYRLLPDGLLELNGRPWWEEIFAFQNIVAIPKSVAKLMVSYDVRVV